MPQLESAVPQLVCPLCKMTLLAEEGQISTLKCAQGHSFDRARQGYWHLLPVQKKRSKDPGDNPEMVIARTQFLDKDHYKPLADRIAKHAQELTPIHSGSVLDMGCGEGYYTSHVAQALSETHNGCSVIGLDISKHAIKAACRREKSVSWLIASGADMPVKAHSQSVITVLFSRLMPEALFNALKSDGFLIFVWPAQQHLIELRTIIYDTIKPSTFDPINELTSLFTLHQQERLTFSFAPQASELEALLSMTPHGQRIQGEKRAQLLAKNNLSLTFDVNIAVFQPTA
jgi:23S rRNA (guanine745-N1)-methyltransferase